MSWRSALPAHLRDVLRDPMWWTESLQLVKTVVAAVIAWLLAARVFELPQSFLAPWAALLVVHATVYRTFSRGLRQVAGAVLGVLLAWAVGNLIGLDAPRGVRSCSWPASASARRGGSVRRAPRSPRPGWSC